MTPGGLWVRSELRRRWRAFAVLAVATGLVAGAVLAFLAGARRTASAYDRFRDDSLAQDLLVQARETDPAVADDVDAARERARRLPGVAASAEMELYIAFSDAAADFDIGILANRDGQLGSTIERPRLLDGRSPHASRANEVALNERAADQLGASVGDTVELQTFSPEQLEKLLSGEGVFTGALEGPLLRLRVTGVVRFAEDVDADEADIHVLASPAFASRYAGDVGHYSGVLALRLDEGVPADGVADRIRGLFPTQDVELSIQTVTDHAGRIRDAMRVLAVGLLLVASSLAVAGAVAVAQALARQLHANQSDQAVLGMLGMARAQRIGAVVSLAVPVAIVAAALAAITAVAASPFFPVSLGRRAEPDRGVAFDWLVLGAGPAALLLAVLALSAFVGWRLSRQTALSVAAAVTSRPTAGSRLAAAFRLGPSGATGLRMALDPGAGSSAVPVRPALTGAVLGLAGVVAAIVFAASLDRLTDTPARYGVPWDFMPEPSEEDARAIVAEPYVGEVGLVGIAFVELDGQEAQGSAMQVLKGNPSFTVLDGRPPANAAEVALGPDQLGRLDVAIGDRIAATGALDGPPAKVEVVGEVLTPGLDDVAFTNGAIFTPEGLDMFRQSDGFRQVVVNWRPGLEPSVAEARLRDDYPDAVTAYSTARPPNEVTNVARVDQLPWGVAGLLALIGLAAVAHALVTMVRRRRRDLAVLRSLGFTRRQVAATTAWQATTLAVVGVVGGIPLGVALGQWAWSVVADGVGVASDAAVPALALVLIVPVTLVLANAIAALPGRAAGRVTAASALRVE